MSVATSDYLKAIDFSGASATQSLPKSSTPPKTPPPKTSLSSQTLRRAISSQSTTPEPLSPRSLIHVPTHQLRDALAALVEAAPKAPSFVDWIHSLGLAFATDGQREICAVAYDGESPTRDDIWGAALVGTRPARGVFCAVCGARGGKSYVLIALRLLYGALYRDLSSLAAGQEAFALVVAPDKKLGREVVKYGKGAARLAGLDVLGMTDDKEGGNVDGFRIRRPDGHIVGFELFAATRGGSALRGRSLTDAALDECAFFRDADFVVNDEELFRAVSARVLPGGQVIIASTPWARKGLLYETWRKNWNNATDATALVAHAPTLVMNDADWIRIMIGRERLRDPDNARREYDAEFPASGASEMFPEELIAACVVPGLVKRAPKPREVVTAGGDFGFERDSSAIAIVHDDGWKLHLGELAELQPTEEEPLKPSRVCSEFASIARAHGASEIMADQHYRQAIAEYIEKENLTFCNAPAGQKAIAESYIRLRSLMKEGRVRLLDNPRLRIQLRSIVSKPIAGGGISIQAPRTAKGGHGDLVSALVCAIWKAVGTEKREPKPEYGTREHWDQEAKRLEQDAEAAMIASQQLSGWKSTFQSNRSAWRDRFGR